MVDTSFAGTTTTTTTLARPTILYWLTPELHKVIFIRAFTTDYCHVFSPIIVTVTTGPLQQVIHATNAMLKSTGSTGQDQAKSSYRLK